MLITFKSRSSPELIMYREHAERILALLHKNPARGVITAAEAPAALEALEQEVVQSKQHPETDVEHDAHTAPKEDDEAEEVAQKQRVGFAARAYPFVEMLRAASSDGDDIVWGV